MELEKVLNDRITNNIINSNITEYDIESAGATTLYFIKGPEIYNNLIRLPKHERNVKIGNMIKEDRSLYTKMQQLILKWFNMFIKANNITDNNFLKTTPDSILIYNRIASVLTFENGLVKFRNKEKITYTSLFKLKNKLILFDRLTKRIRIKGLGSEEETINYEFVKYPLKELCCIIDDSSSLSRTQLFNALKVLRINYLNSKNLNIFKSIDNDNKFKYVIDGYETFSDVYLDEKEDCILIKSDNYLNYILPLMQSVI